ncbi:hypothetical protein H5410_022071 [Solanum commersonii]|uniref:Uncharacterized protein n=1 Tax=Solanum commersonii TaxID=4109 RepID=A0A9J5ZIQ5_SOLCO|nr:hypothetical protein H5410_022071 [Solanum commersonii]
MVKEGKLWWKKHIEARYFSNVCIDTDSLAQEFPRILRRIKELAMELIFVEPSVSEESLDYMAPLFLALIVITKTKGLDNELDPTLTTMDRHRREVERKYPLNAHVKALLVIGPGFHESVDYELPTDEDRLCTGSDVDFDSDEGVDPAQASDEADGGDAMQD